MSFFLQSPQRSLFVSSLNDVKGFGFLSVHTWNGEAGSEDKKHFKCAFERKEKKKEEK